VAGGLDEPSLACPPGPLAAAAEERGIPVEPLSERPLELRRGPRDRVASPVRLAAHAREVRAQVASLRPDLVIGWGMRSALAAAAALRRAEPRPAFLFHHHDFLPGPLIARAVRAAARAADRVVCLSQAIAAELNADGALDGRLTVLPPGVDLSRFDPARRVPAPGPEALVLGAIVRWKRPDLALEAAALARETRPGLRVRLGGPTLDAEGERLLAELADRATRPDLAGHVDLAGVVDPPEALARAGCLLHCADREPFGIVLVEALAAGVPAIAPAAGGPLEILDEDCGRLYPPGDVAAAAAALADVLGDPDRAARMGAAGRARAERDFDLADSRRRFGELAAEAAA
jgi:glycosyltransferase involved in cell wall biosynthesis